MLVKLLFILGMIIQSNIGLYNITVPQIEGGNRALSALAAKKILVVTLPIERNAYADSLLYALDTLAIAHQHSITVIAVPAFEDGYTSALKDSLQNWYRSFLSNTIIVTSGLQVRRTSGSQQHDLFKWLTRKEENGRFNIDAITPGYKYFIDTGEQLFAVLRPHTHMWSNAVYKVITGTIEN